MSRFKGNPCPVCCNSFTEDDDIVVCPDCGTPHHRNCYAENGECSNSGRHESGFVWRSIIENATAGYGGSAAAETDGDPKWKAFTETLGKNMDDEKLSSFKKFFDTVEKRRDNLEKMRERFETRDIFGVSEHEIISFQSTGNPFNIERYRKMAKERNPVSFNILAGFLSPVYPFCFRANIIGIILAVINFILQIPYMLSVFFEWRLFSNTELLTIIQAFYDSYFLEISSVSIGVVILTSVFFDYFYLKWMTAKIKNIRAEFEAAEESENKLGTDYYSALSQAGKPRLLRGFLDYFLTWSSLVLLMFVVLKISGHV